MHTEGRICGPMNTWQRKMKQMGWNRMSGQTLSTSSSFFVFIWELKDNIYLFYSSSMRQKTRRRFCNESKVPRHKTSFATPAKLYIGISHSSVLNIVT
mmetsp:Transcript_1643/g.3000  ORF Transcript_1643/g.3000 Transcript_1643/m.3000 type:complete len:98 (+) Transcript_1643:446-739(+)